MLFFLTHCTLHYYLNGSQKDLILLNNNVYINYFGRWDVVIAITWKSWLTLCYRWCFLSFRALAEELFHQQLAKWVAATLMKLYVQKPNFNPSLIFVNTQSYSSADLYFV